MDGPAINTRGRKRARENEFSGPAANTRSRKRAFENESPSGTAPNGQSVESSTSHHKRPKLRTGKSTLTGAQQTKPAKGASGASTAQTKRPAPAKLARSSAAPQPAPNIKQSAETSKTSNTNRGDLRDQEDGDGDNADADADADAEGNDDADTDEENSEWKDDLPDRFPRMPKPDYRNVYVIPEHIKKHLMVPNLDDPKIRNLMSGVADWKPGSDRWLAFSRGNIWRLTHEATSDRCMLETEWESGFLVDTDLPPSKVLQQTIKRRGVPKGDRKLVGADIWAKEEWMWRQIKIF